MLPTTKQNQMAGAMDRAKKLVTIRDTDIESAFGYIYSVSGPGLRESF